MQKLRVDLTGQKFFKLSIIEAVPKKIRGRTHYKCLCDCGTEKIIDGSKIKGGHTKSCGCLHKYVINEHRKLPEGEANRNVLLASYKRNAKNKKLEFSLSDEESIIMFKSKCYYCGKEPYCSLERKNTNGSYIYTGIDRLDNSLGYTTENTVPCCSKCNYIKSDMSYKEFIEWIENVHTNVKQGVYLR